jgi:hypothetical protein
MVVLRRHLDEVLGSSDLIPDEFRPWGRECPLHHGPPAMEKAWGMDEFVLVPADHRDRRHRRVETGHPPVSAIFVTPYPPGFPVLVPGQAFSKDILDFMDALDVREIHGFNPALGYRVFTPETLEALTS